MTQANDSILVTPGAGASVATHLANGKEHEVVMQADHNGHIHGTTPMYVLYVPPGAAGASKVYFDLFNATGSGVQLRVHSVKAIKDASVAVTGVVGLNLFLTRTSAIGTAGTAATLDGTSLTAATISERDPGNAALHANVTARLAPTGGGTAGAVLGFATIMPEETNAANFDGGVEMIPQLTTRQPIVVPENTGLRVVQGAVASVGNTGFLVTFEAVAP